MARQSEENPGSVEPLDAAPLKQQSSGSLSVEDDPEGTTDPAELAGTSGPDDTQPAYRPSISEADTDEGTAR